MFARPYQVFETRREGTHSIPPAADAPIVIRDRGSCGPRFLRSTLNMVPQTGDLLKGASLPFVAIINPLALQDPGDDPVEVRARAGSWLAGAPLLAARVVKGLWCLLLAQWSTFATF